MNANAKKLSIVLIVLLISSACSSSNDANKRNIKNALEKYYFDRDRCLVLQRPSKRRFRILNEQPGIYVFDFEAAHMKSALESAVSFGLLESNVSEIRYSRRFGGEIQTAIGRKYIVTNLGESVFRSVSEGADFITICYGEYRIDEIQSFSEPSDMMGYRVTNVNYVYTIVNIEKWARERNVLEWVKDSWSMGPFEANIASKQLTDDLLDEPQNESITLHLTNQGWSAEQPSFR